MLNCRACLWRCIDALDTSVSVSASLSLRLRRNVTSAFAQGQQRSIRTAPYGTDNNGTARPSSNVKPNAPLQDAVRNLAHTEEEPWRNSTQAASLRKKVRVAQTRRPVIRGDRRADTGNGAFAKTAREGVSKKTGIEIMEGSSYKSDAAKELAKDSRLRKLGRRDPSTSSKDWNRRRREMQHLADPLALATFVKKELMKDKDTEMLQLVQMASHSMQSVVSWNHLIDYHLAKGRVSQAFKIYNDMKKRAQFPDAYTYSILLRGLSINAHDSGALSKALSVYHSMFAPNARVEPSIMHTNAMLRVCSRCQDMDALWGVAAKIPESGPAAANTITYVTILNAIRQSLLIDTPKGESEDQIAARVERGISEGRKIWYDVISRWRNADLVIGEELVCAMGRLLLIGSRPQDYDDVLSLVEQTMDIPRLVPRLGTRERTEAGLSHLRAPHVPGSLRLADDHLSPQKDQVRGDEFLALSPSDVRRNSPLTYATPSNNTLSLIQEACQKVVAIKASKEYWDILTDPQTHAIVPDANNLNFRLRLLRQNRASSEAVALLKGSFVAKGIAPSRGTFRIAMSTCGRDKNNPNSLRNASEILGIMATVLEDYDAKSVTMYADLASSFPSARGSHLIDALTFLRPATHSLRIQLGVATAESRGEGMYRPKKADVILSGDERKDAIVALRKVYAIFDKLLFSELLPEDQKPPFKKERAKLGAYLNRLGFQDGTVKWDGPKPDEGKGVQTDAGETESEHAKEGGESREKLRGAKATGTWKERTTGLPVGNRRPWSSPRLSGAM